jgi:carboxymethylenebutenolidase
MGELIKLDEGKFDGYVAEPPDIVRGGLVVIHEIWGLVDHVKDVADRLAGQGYLAVAPDLLSGIGITPEIGQELQRIRTMGSAEERTKFQPMLREKMAPMQAPDFAQGAIGKLRTTVDYLAGRPEASDRIGVIGFCFGGSYSFALAAADQRIRAAVPFYGSPNLDEVAKIKCPVLAFYGDQDTRLTAGLAELRKAMAAAGVDFTEQVYPGVGHAFFNDSSPSTYDAATAKDAWNRTLAFLDRTLTEPTA